MERSPAIFVERPPASSTMIPRGARSQGCDVRSTAAAVGVGEFAEPDALLGRLFVAGSRCEDHGFAQVLDLGNEDALAIAKSALPSVRPPARAEGGSAGHACNDFTLALDGEQCAEGGNAPGEFLGAVNGVNDEAGTAGAAGTGGIAAAHFLAEHIQSEAAGGDFGAGHGFDGAVGFGDASAIALAFDAQAVGTKIAHGQSVGFIGNLGEQCSILLLETHHAPWAWPAEPSIVFVKKRARTVHF